MAMSMEYLRMEQQALNELRKENSELKVKIKQLKECLETERRAMELQLKAANTKLADLQRALRPWGPSA